jgi:undecaprenyl-diphosphatase
MEWAYAIIKGIIQGATEFIPVSSSAHLVLFRFIMEATGRGSALPNPIVDEFFDILLHLGTLLAVIIYFRTELRDFFKALICREVYTTDATGQRWRTRPLLIALVIAFCTTAFVSLMGMKGSERILEGLQGIPFFAGIPDVTQFYIEYPFFVAINLLITGGFLWFAESHTRPNPLLPARPASRGVYLLPRRAFFIGLAQSAAALFRGISRSGSTMAMGVLCGLTRQQAARFSFLLSIPIFSMAALYETMKLSQHAIALDSLPWPAMLAGTAVSFVTGYACIAWLLSILARYPLSIFSYYCWGLGLLMIYFTTR